MTLEATDFVSKTVRDMLFTVDEIELKQEEKITQIQDMYSISPIK